jgi:hypothetical protein
MYAANVHRLEYESQKPGMESEVVNRNQRLFRAGGYDGTWRKDPQLISCYF